MSNSQFSHKPVEISTFTFHFFQALLLLQKKSLPGKGGPLSLLINRGRPCVAKMHSNFGMLTVADVEFTVSTSGKRLYASITTSR